MQKQRPAIGRVVHYIAYGTPNGEYKAGAHRAATITEVHGDTCVSLCIMNPTGLFFQTSIIEDPAGEKPGSWHWPEFVAPIPEKQTSYVEDMSARESL